MIRFDRVSKRYGPDREALAAVSFEVGDGELAFITGRSGCGKSTVLRLIALLERASSGQIWVNGENLAALRARHVPRFRRRMGLVLQQPHLSLERTLSDNVELPLLLADVPARQRRTRVRTALEQVGLLAEERLPVRELSAGQQSRAALARALVSGPALLLADEPTAQLDAALAASVMELLRRLNGTGVTVVIATHDLKLARESGGREISVDRADAGGGELAALPSMAAVR